MCRPRGMVARKCGLSTTSRSLVAVHDADLERHRHLVGQVAVEPQERVRHERRVRRDRTVGGRRSARSREHGVDPRRVDPGQPLDQVVAHGGPVPSRPASAAAPRRARAAAAAATRGSSPRRPRLRARLARIASRISAVRSGGSTCAHSRSMTSGVVLHVGALVQVERAGELLEVDDVGQVGLGEAQDRERPAGRGVPAVAENGAICSEMFGSSFISIRWSSWARHQLGADRASGAARPRRSTAHSVGAPGAVSSCLAPHPQLDAALDLPGVGRGRAG